MSAALSNMTNIHSYLHLAVVGVGALVSATAFAFLIPLDSVPAVMGIFIIIGMAYVVCIALWLITMSFYAGKESNLIWLNTHLMFLVVLPATIGATAMNVVSIQNTRNLIATQGA
jgi:membrane-associated HD superfamily phosphohydrolase